jgi:ribonuclease P protein component
MSLIHKYTFGKDERLKSPVQIGKLFASGKPMVMYPFKVFWNYTGPEGQKKTVKVAVSVPKKKFRKAVDRNLIKRRLREAYRKNKFLLIDPLSEKKIYIILIILYLPDKILGYNEIQAGCCRILRELSLLITSSHE